MRNRIVAVVCLAVMMCFAGVSSAQSSTHSVALTCTASTTLGVTYNFYRATVSGGPYSQINLSPSSLCSFTDSLVTNGATYFYVANAFDAVTLSAYSNEVKVVIPSAPAPPTNLTATVKP